MLGIISYLLSCCYLAVHSSTQLYKITNTHDQLWTTLAIYKMGQHPCPWNTSCITTFIVNRNIAWYSSWVQLGTAGYQAIKESIMICPACYLAVILLLSRSGHHCCSYRNMVWWCHSENLLIATLRCHLRLTNTPGTRSIDYCKHGSA